MLWRLWARRDALSPRAWTALFTDETPEEVLLPVIGALAAAPDTALEQSLRCPARTEADDAAVVAPLAAPDGLLNRSSSLVPITRRDFRPALPTKYLATTVTRTTRPPAGWPPPVSTTTPRRSGRPPSTTPHRPASSPPSPPRSPTRTRSTATNCPEAPRRISPSPRLIHTTSSVGPDVSGPTAPSPMPSPQGEAVLAHHRAPLIAHHKDGAECPPSVALASRTNVYRSRLRHAGESRRLITTRCAP
ncbi:DUF317 domain-containing protein [Streptomyces sp. PSKA01]|uniref:DUF317 domain-containing protein n=1 Tax=Streptomyces cupreus TaxID=2759956 RepID=A0A7X1JAY8_9ACTN|nr:DUF317 domain-containing protein [Streptomyces cupreus]